MDKNFSRAGVSELASARAGQRYKPGAALASQALILSDENTESSGCAREMVAPTTRGKRTAEQIRQRLRTDTGSIRQLALRYGVNPKTVVKWRHRSSVCDATPASRPRALTRDEEGQVVAARKFMLLPLDDCLYIFRRSIPHLTRSTLHRCLQRHGVSRLQASRRRVNWAKGSKNGRLGVFLIDVTAVQCRDGNCFVVSAADIYSKAFYTEFVSELPIGGGSGFVSRMKSAVPYIVKEILITDNWRAAQFFGMKEAASEAAAQKNGFTVRRWAESHMPADESHAHGLEYIMGTDGAILRDDTLEEFREYIVRQESTCYKDMRLKSLNGLTPYQYICKIWKQTPSIFVRSPE